MPTKRSDKPLIVALDIGSSSTRALLYDSSGRLQAGREVKIAYEQTLTRDGGVECDPDRLFALTLSALKKLVRACARPELERIAAIGISCFWHALMGVDAAGKAVTPLYSWADTRASSEAVTLADILDADDYHARTGAFIHSCFWPAKIAWLRRRDPRLADRVARWVSFPDYLAYRIGGEAATSISIASATGVYNQDTGRWDGRTLSAIGLEEGLLPRIALSEETFRPADRALVPRLPDVPWYPAYGDGACSNIGAGGVSAHRVVINLATSGAVRVLGADMRPGAEQGLFRYRFDSKRSVVGGALSNAGNVREWMLRTLNLRSRSKLEALLRKAEPVGHGLIAMPFWAGERSPGWSDAASGSVMGLNLSTSAADIAQAALESIAYTVRSVWSDIASVDPGARETIVSGGMAANSRYVRQLLADVLDCPVRVSRDPEPSGRGAALAISERLGALSDVSDSPDRLSAPILPDSEASEIYSSAYQRFQQIYAGLPRNQAIQTAVPR
jgi:gluconokinase